MKNEFMEFMNQMYESSEVMRDLYDFESNMTGKFGEFLTNKISYQLPGYFKILNNLLLPIGSYKTELDTVIIHSKGFFVLESKNYGGWIFGKEDSQHWTQSFPNGDKYTFYNPVKQNNTHCAALSNILGINKQVFYSYIVFSERCTLKEVPKDVSNAHIINRDLLYEFLIRDIEYSNLNYPEEQVNKFYNILKQYVGDKNSKKEHKERVRKYSSGYVCPKCYGELVLKKGKYGRFIGCSKYPQCRFTRPATEFDINHFS